MTVEHLAGTSVALVGLDGGTVATTTLAGEVRAVAGGPGFALVASTQGLTELTTSGQVIDLGPAGPASGLSVGLAVAPDGARWAFGTHTESGTTFTNRLYVQGVKEPAHVIAERQGSTTAPAPSSDAPAYWTYSVMSWVPQGIVIARVPYGIGFVGAFPDELNRYTALVDPSTGTATAISNDAHVFLSSVATDGTQVLFHTTASGNADEIRLVSGGKVTSTTALTGQNLAGAGIYNPAGPALAYSTVAPNQDPLGQLTSTTLRVLNVPAGDVNAYAPKGLSGLAWMPEGWILAVQFSSSGGNLASAAVKVSPSGAVQPIVSVGSSGEVRAVVTEP